MTIVKIPANGYFYFVSMRTSERDTMDITMNAQRYSISSGGATSTMTLEDLERHSRPGPRYTSYPTAPEWSDSFDASWYVDGIRGSTRPLSLYAHVPFCETLCLYCGCNVIINKDKKVATPYLELLKQEIDLVACDVDPGRVVEQIHLGGGTPTYLHSEQLEELMSHIGSRFTISRDAEISIELEPRTTTREQLHTLRRIGFNRVSMGVQDFDPIVQKAIRRIQSYETTRAVYDECRRLGFDSINLDLIYGLPHQTVGSFAETVRRVIEMNPDRIALFSYAHVPWIKKQQRSFARHLPGLDEKFSIFCEASRLLVDAGYRHIGLDHFVRPSDELSHALDARTLHRNFQGYTTKAGCELLAFGVSSISMLDDVYVQNARDIESYGAALEAGRLPVMRGFALSDEDRLRRSVITSLLCHGEVVKRDIERTFAIDFDSHFSDALEQLRTLSEEGMVALDDDRVRAVGFGRIFIRNVAMAFDAYLESSQTMSTRLFSKTL